MVLFQALVIESLRQIALGNRQSERFSAQYQQKKNGKTQGCRRSPWLIGCTKVNHIRRIPPACPAEIPASDYRAAAFPIPLFGRTSLAASRPNSCGVGLSRTPFD
jgi:hypothetical protein